MTMRFGPRSADLMLQPISGLQIEQVFIDSGFRPDKPEQGNEHKVYEFCRRYSWLCLPDQGPGRPDAAVQDDEDRGEAGRQAGALLHRVGDALDRLLQVAGHVAAPHADGRPGGVLRQRGRHGGLREAGHERGSDRDRREAAVGEEVLREPLPRLRGPVRGDRLLDERSAHSRGRRARGRCVGHPTTARPTHPPVGSRRPARTSIRRGAAAACARASRGSGNG